MKLLEIAAYVLIFCCDCLADGTVLPRVNATHRHNSLRRSRSIDHSPPIDCKLMEWASWTTCRSCQSKVVRFRYLEQPSQFGGVECPGSQWEEKACPNGAVCQEKTQCGDMFPCKSSGRSYSGRCLSQHLKCNGERDCQDGTDEKDCEEVHSRNDKCANLFPIPGSVRATQGYNVLTGDFVQHNLDPEYFGGVCEYVYNGEWRKLTYDAFCENLYYNDDEKYYRRPYNFHSYHFMAQARTDGSSEYFDDVASFLRSRDSFKSSNFGVSIEIEDQKVGLSGSQASRFLNNITQFASQNVGIVRLVSTVQTAQFKMRSRDLVLHEHMQQALLELPEEYDFGSYAHFINTFGTHYITQGSMGGVLEHVLVVDKEAMSKSEVSGKTVERCLGLSFDLSVSEENTGLSIPVKGSINTCKQMTTVDKSGAPSSSFGREGFTLVKGGSVASTADIFTDSSLFKTWSKSLKYSPDLIDFEILPLYELVRLSTSADQAKSRIPLLKRAWDEYLQQFNSCRCAPCRNNAISVLAGTSCRCVCRSGDKGQACEETQQEVSTDGAWSCWTSWSSCLSGRKTRRRECSNPQPAGGAPCLGSPTQTMSC